MQGVCMGKHTVWRVSMFIIIIIITKKPRNPSPGIIPVVLGHVKHRTKLIIPSPECLWSKYNVRNKFWIQEGGEEYGETKLLVSHHYFPELLLIL